MSVFTHPMSCTGDCCNYDIEQDERWSMVFPGQDHIVGSAFSSSTSSHAGRVAANPGTPPHLPHGGVPTPLTDVEAPQ